MTLRDRLIASGAIRPLSLRPTLRLDDRGRAAAAEHATSYLANPDRYALNPFYFDVDEWMFSTPEVSQ